MAATLEIANALERHRMRHHIGIDKLSRRDRLIGELLKERQHARCRLAGCSEILEGRLVGRRFHGARVIENEPLAIVPAPPMMPCPARSASLCRISTPSHGRGTEQHADDHCRALTVNFLPHASKMAAGDMASLMRKHADHLVWCLGLREQAGIDKHALPAGDESVDAGIVDQIDFDRPWTETGGLKYRLRIEPHQAFDLGIANEFWRPLLGKRQAWRERHNQG